MSVYLLFDVGSTYTKGVLVDITKEKILATASSMTTAETDIRFGIESIKSQMGEILEQVNITKTLVCSSAKGGLTMIAVGLIPDLTLKAATLACYSAGAKVIGSYSFELNQHEIEEIETSNCDILLLCGGTNGGNSTVVINNANRIASIRRKFPIIYAGNKSCQDQVNEILNNAGFECTFCDNVMPSYGVLEVNECRNRIREIFLDHIIKAKGLSSLGTLIEEIILPTPYSVMEALKLLAKGTLNERGLGDLMAIDIGGATTDVYSMNSTVVIADHVDFKGLQEPLEKRSVEGDLGVRFNAKHVLALKKNETEITVEFNRYISQFATDRYIVPNPVFDQLLAKWCCEIAAVRHAGRIDSVCTPLGVSFCQQGKDLRDVKIMIGIGGPILYSSHPEEILEKALYSDFKKEILLPHKTDYYLDKHYVISCLGLLASRHPDEILRILKKNVEKLNNDQR